VGIDLVMIKNLAGTPEYWLNCICWGTNFQLMGHVGSTKDSASVWKCFVQTWIRFFGIPEILVVDPGKEFEGDFGQNISQRGCALLPTDARTPWQNGKTERAGKEWKRTFKKARRKEEPLNEDEFIALGLEVCSCRNRYNNRSGYSPLQRVFGNSTRLPCSLLSDDAIDAQYLSEDTRIFSSVREAPPGCSARLGFY